MKAFLKYGLKSITTASFLALSLFISAQAFCAQSALVDQVQGEVMVRLASAGADQWTPITEKTVLNSGDTIQTKNGTCTLIYSDQATFKVENNTSFTVMDNEKSQDIWLNVGKLKGKINKDKVIKPFQVVTPTAIAAVRGTEVDFDFNGSDALTVDLHDKGPLQVYNDDADMTLDLANTKKIQVTFTKETGVLVIKNDCTSNGPVSFSVQGTAYSLDACGEKSFTIKSETAGGETAVPGTSDAGSDESVPNEDQPPPGSSSPS